ncbi:MAG: lactaldehyde dehydrogenase [Candidatus Gottesmanbacteria bacterium GW2011_GWA2_47_9]|uniref:Lactaldehyde dehydrogenase n=1 Tax=Candidatus Gottesmanbacteria bacterium GW2011_GWA2_47_9 TaxID=1618445 RepID=A0A0G1TX04_9BACT|nr:MAG: lactaldehyde dehydrogenase [Candidatus Gottesmanbacteria bacterium GW2011_GWA2_47_9]
MNLTAREIVKGGFAFAGQRCTAIKYVLGTQGVLEQLLPVVVTQMKELVAMGDPRSTETKLVGPIVSESAAKQFQQWIDASVQQGAKVAIGGICKGNYMEPTILTNVSPNMPVVAHEVFGPLISFITIKI